MSEQSQRDQESNEEVPEWVRKHQKAVAESEPVEIEPSRAWRFTQPLGFNEDGTPTHRLSREEMKRIKDIREGRDTEDSPDGDR